MQNQPINRNPEQLGKLNIKPWKGMGLVFNKGHK